MPLRQLVVLSPASLNEPGSTQRSNPIGGLRREAPVEMLTFGVDSVGGAIQEDVEVFVTQQRGFRSRGFKVSTCLIKKNAFAATTN